MALGYAWVIAILTGLALGILVPLVVLPAVPTVLGAIILVLLATRRARYSPEAYVRYRRHLRGALRFGLRWFGALTVLLALAVFLLQRGEGSAWIAAVLRAVFVLSVVIALARLPDFVVPHLMTYFSAPVPGSGLGSGSRLLAHSRTLDGLAESIGVRRVGSFVSDDDLFDGSGPTWHPAAAALATFEGLLRHCGTHPSVRAAEQDLEQIRHRLGIAASGDVQFCLLLRDVGATNAMEWGLRRGYP